MADPNSEFEKLLEGLSQGMMKQQLKDRPELWSKLTPNYPTGCKRVIISDGMFPGTARGAGAPFLTSGRLLPDLQPSKR